MLLGLCMPRPSARVPRVAFLLGLVLMLASCHEAPTGCDLCTTSLTVAGRVESGAGAPVRGAEVSVAVRAAGCSGGERLVFDAATGNPLRTLSTDVDGRFAIRLRSPESPGARCLELRVAIPGAAAPVTVQREVVFASDWPTVSRAEAQITVRTAPD